MNAFLLRWTVAMLTLMCAAEALADGKMFAEKVPATIPYQRAIILHTGETQTLVLQSQYQIPGASDTKALGWVVPVPATPEVATANANRAEWVFNWCDRSAAPKITEISAFLLLTGFGIALVNTVICITGAFVARRPEKRRRFRILGLVSAFAAVLCIFAGPLVIRMKKGISGIETLASKKAGIYDITVIRAKAAADMLRWLKDNGFGFGPEDETAFRSYIDRGWVFVAAKIDPAADMSDHKAVSKGLAAPLLLRFSAKNPVYPLALTATGGHDTEVLIYLLSDTPRTGDGRLELRSAGGPPQGWFPSGHLMTDENTEFLSADPAMDRAATLRLSKFKGTLTPDQMRSDLEFVPDPRQTDRREHIYR
ncbi:MAG: DUF2330 domain-containing protein [Verrucomicrobia bacterium]|nr:DUF2330 domain-containing protein [Verrucomicrobiota bacterium]